MNKPFTKYYFKNETGGWGYNYKFKTFLGLCIQQPNSKLQTPTYHFKSIIRALRRSASVEIIQLQQYCRKLISQQIEGATVFLSSMTKCFFVKLNIVISEFPQTTLVGFISICRTQKLFFLSVKLETSDVCRCWRRC